MHLPQVNYLAVLVTGIVIFLIGGLWYSPLLFARRWVAMLGKSEDELKANAGGPASYLLVFLCGLMTSFAMAIVVAHFRPTPTLKAIEVAILCWAGFAGATSFGTSLFSGERRGLWLINSSYNLVSFIVAAVILNRWR
jgi:Protein of unknown function (DUF1761)